MTLIVHEISLAPLVVRAQRLATRSHNASKASDADREFKLG
jgi:hypothetical protein